MPHTDNTPLFAVVMAGLIIGAYLVGRYWGKPRIDQAAAQQENYRLRFSHWLRFLWGVEDVLGLHVDGHVFAAGEVVDTVPIGAEAPNYSTDSNHDLRTWIVHTFNLAELRLKEIEAIARTRGPKFSESEEEVFQRLLKDARFLHCMTEAAMYARSENYNEVRPALLAVMARYPRYTPEMENRGLWRMEKGLVFLQNPAPGFDPKTNGKDVNGFMMCTACDHGMHGPMCSASPRCFCERNCNVDYTQPHNFIGRQDRGCDGCGEPDRAAIHSPQE